MAQRFHFHTEDGRFIPDEQGLELPDLRAAQLMALNVLTQILARNPDEFWDTEHFAVIVADDQKKLLFAVNLSSGI